MKIPLFSFLAIFCLALFSFNWTNTNTASTTNCVVNLGFDVELQLGDTYDFDLITTCDLNTIESISWTPATGLSCSDCLSPTVSPLEDVCYTITLELQDGCTATDDVCIELDACPTEYSDNSIDEISPEQINDAADLTLTISRTQYVHLEIVDGDEVQYALWEGWLRAGVRTVNVDFSTVPSGSHQLRARLYPENEFVTIQKN